MSALRTTPVMFVRDGDALVAVPQEDAAVLARYRDSMPLVFEPQYSGDRGLYPLIDENQGPDDAPRASTLERLARATAGHLRDARHGEDVPAPDLARLARAVVGAYLADVADFAAAVHAGDDAERGRAVNAAAETLCAQVATVASTQAARVTEVTS